MNITTEPLNAAAFSPFGQLIDTGQSTPFMINDNRCQRFHDLAAFDFDASGRAGLSLFTPQKYRLPHSVSLMERHPLGSQTFIPMSQTPYLVVVAEDTNGAPANIRAFVAAADQIISIGRNVWHGVLTPLDSGAQFAVIDWIGQQNNLQEHLFTEGAPVIHLAS